MDTLQASRVLCVLSDVAGVGELRGPWTDATFCLSVKSRQKSTDCPDFQKAAEGT